MTGFHWVMERPDSVSRVAPPMSTMAKTSAATATSQTRTLVGALKRSGAAPARERLIEAIKSDVQGGGADYPAPARAPQPRSGWPPA